VPFKSEEQKRLFYAALRDPALRKKVGLSLDVIKEYIQADKTKRNRVKENPNADVRLRV
jgi:hypothetical protein